MNRPAISIRHLIQNTVKILLVLLIPSLLILNVGDAMAANNHTRTGQNPIKSKWSRGLVCVKIARPMQNRDRIA